MVGVNSRDTNSKKVGNEFFAIEGFINQREALHDAAFYAKTALLEKRDFFEIVEHWLGASLWVGRPMLPRRDWPSLFKGSINSWSELLRQIFKLVESALYYAERAGHLKLTACVSSPTKKEAPCSRSSKRKAQKRRVLKQRAELCPVCEGSLKLLDDDCPLCVDVSDEEDTLEVPSFQEQAPATEDIVKHLDIVHSEEDKEDETTALQSEEDKDDELEESEIMMYSEAPNSDEDNQEEILRALLDCEDDDDDSWQVVGHRKKDVTSRSLAPARAGPKENLSSRHALKAAATSWLSGWKPGCVRREEAADTDRILYESSHKMLAEKGTVKAVVRNTFVHILPHRPVASPGLSRARSLPCW
jgi:hypothetical protein